MHLSIALALALLAPSSADDSLILKQSTVGSIDEANDQFGRALAVGDFDGDGLEDLAVGVPNEDQDGLTDIGMVVVFYGDGSGLDTGHYEKFTQLYVSGAANESFDLFGYSLAAGDLDGDGYDDLAVGIPFEDAGAITDAGAVAVMYGSSAGLLPSRTELVTQTSIASSNASGDLFGFALTIADFDGDQFDDLAVGTPNEDIGGVVDAGRATVLYGSANGVLPASWENIDQNATSGTAAEAEDRFGYALASGDLDGDGDDELIFGTPFEDSGLVLDVGIVAIFKGASAGLLPADSKVYFEDAVAGNTFEAGDKFGYALAVGDFNGDGFSDVAASAPYEDVSADGDGMIAILRGQAGAHPTTWLESVTQASAHGTREDYDTTGLALAAGDFDGDGFFDLAVGVPYEDELERSSNGVVLAYFGGSAGLLPSRAYWYGQSYVKGSEEDSDLFGFVLAAGDFDGDGVASVAAGSPYEGVGSETDAGSVFVRTIEPALPDVVGETAIVIDRPSGRVLGVRFPDRRRAPASTTKMMTMLLAAEAIAAGDVSLADTVTIRSGVHDETPDIPLVVTDLEVGDQISLRDLLHLVMLDSDNLAANAVGMYVGGSRAAFLAMMNARAAELDLDETSYVSICGRDPEDFVPGCSGDEFDTPACAHYSTARDLAALARFALDVPLFKTIVGRTSWTTTTWRRPVIVRDLVLAPIDMDKTVNNSNSLLGGGYPGAYGVKTGTSNRAGSNLVSAATDGNFDVIAVILGAHDNGSAEGDRYTESTKLLDFGLATAP